MKSTLFLIGKTVVSDAMLQRYIERHLGASGIQPDCIVKSEESGRPFLDELTHLGSRSDLYIFCDPGNAALIARELCTFIGDTIAMKNDCLFPSRARSVNSSYYTMEVKGCAWHIVTAHAGRDLPELEFHNGGDRRAVLHLIDQDASQVQKLLKQLEAAFHIKSTLTEPVKGWIECRIEAERYGDIVGAKAHLISQFQTVIASENVAEWLIETLEEEQKTITFAESCTGGLLSYYLTKESGASGVFEGALITYSNRLKSSWIAVDHATLEANGAVSKAVVTEMSEGALEVAGADYAIAVSGIAGPTGGTSQKPVGTVFVAVRSAKALVTVGLHLHGDRNYIQEQTVLHAIKMLFLLDKETFFNFSQNAS